MTAAFPLVSVEAMRALEAAAIATGTPEHVLQDRAGRATADAISERFDRGARQVVGLVGAGNNGRDAVVAARYLAARGHRAGLWLVPRHAVTPAELSGLSAAGIEYTIVDGAGPLDPLRASLGRADVAIDGLLGIGARGPMRGDVAALADLVNAVRTARPDLLVVAVDVPSGVNADDGSVAGVAVRADLTVTFGAVKTGLLRFPAALYAGRIEPRSIGLPDDVASSQRALVLDEGVVRPLLPDRPLDVHKYRLGRVLVVAGSDQFVGAASLCASAAARSGCGLVAVASSDRVKAALAPRLPEATYPVPPFDIESDPSASADRVIDVLPRYQALVIGPGLGRSPATGTFFRAIMRANGASSEPVPSVVDADGLNLLADWDGWPDSIAPNTLLTPHMGEMSRLTGQIHEPAEPSWELATAWARRWRQTVVLKGPFTSIGAPAGPTWVYPHANSALATAGTGDVLAGLCAGLIAQGGGAVDAARLGVVAHAVAAREVLAGRGWRTLLASDLPEGIPLALAIIGRAERR